MRIRRPCVYTIAIPAHRQNCSSLRHAQKWPETCPYNPLIHRTLVRQFPRPRNLPKPWNFLDDYGVYGQFQFQVASQKEGVAIKLIEHPHRLPPDLFFVLELSLELEFSSLNLDLSEPYDIGAFAGLLERTLTQAYPFLDEYMQLYLIPPCPHPEFPARRFVFRMHPARPYLSEHKRDKEFTRLLLILINVVHRLQTDRQLHAEAISHLKLSLDPHPGQRPLQEGVLGMDGRLFRMLGRIWPFR